MTYRHVITFLRLVQVLLSSTGRKDVLDQENGVEQFVSTEEMKLKEKTTEEQRKVKSSQFTGARSFNFIIIQADHRVIFALESIENHLHLSTVCDSS